MDMWRKKSQNVRYVLKISVPSGRQLARAVGREEVEVVSHLRKRLDVLLVRDNIAMLHARAQNLPTPQVDGDVDVDN